MGGSLSLSLSLSLRSHGHTERKSPRTSFYFGSPLSSLAQVDGAFDGSVSAARTRQTNCVPHPSRLFFVFVFILFVCVCVCVFAASSFLLFGPAKKETRRLGRWRRSTLTWPTQHKDKKDDPAKRSTRKKSDGNLNTNPTHKRPSRVADRYAPVAKRPIHCNFDCIRSFPNSKHRFTRFYWVVLGFTGFYRV